MLAVKIFGSLFLLLRTADAALTVGTEFMTAFPCVGSTANLYLYITNANANEATLSIYSSYPGFDPIEQSVDGQSTQQIQFYDPDIQVCDSSRQTPRGLLIQSTRPVSVYVDIETTNGLQVSNFLVLPTSALGRQYALNGGAINVMIAKQDDTQITVGTNPDPIILNRLEAYSFSDYRNLTTNKPIALIYARQGQGSNSYSNDAVMALPNTYKATEFPVVPHPNSSQTTIRVFAFEEHTYILLNGLSQTMINAGASYDIPLTQPAVIATSKKAQIVSGGTYSYEASAVVVPPTYFITSASVPFHTMTHIQYQSRDPVHTLVVIAPSASVGQISVDGVVINALQYRRIATSSYYYVFTPVSGDQHVITKNSENVKYAASVYSTYYNAQYANAKFDIGYDLPASTKHGENEEEQ